MLLYPVDFLHPLLGVNFRVDYVLEELFCLVPVVFIKDNLARLLLLFNNLMLILIKFVKELLSVKPVCYFVTALLDSDNILLFVYASDVKDSAAHEHRLLLRLIFKLT